MLVFLQAGLAVLAVPKTATVALEATLGPLADLRLSATGQGKHMPFRRFAAELAPGLAARRGGPLEVLAMIREPCDWLGSWYRFRQREALGKAQHSTRGQSFEAFVQAFCSADPPPWATLRPQSHFVRDAAGGIGPDRLFRYDDMAGFVDYLGRRLGRAVEMPRRNVSPPGDLTLSAAGLARLRAQCAADFALYRSLPDGGGRP